MNNEPVNFLKKCIEIYSPSSQEAEYSKFLGDYLKEHDFTVHYDRSGNLIAEKGSGKPILLLVSHMDTIPGELPVIEKEGKLFGRGAVDCKPSLAAMVYSICKYDFTAENVGKVVFAGIVREEESLEGIEEFLKSGMKADYALFGEPTGVNQICIGYKGRLCIGYRVLSKTGHVASSWQYVSSTEMCLQIWNIIKGVCWHLTDMYCKKNTGLKYFQQIIPNLSVISGGHLTNCVPSECVMHVDIRFPPDINSNILLEEIKRGVIDFDKLYRNQTKNQDFKIQESISSLIEGYEVKGDELVVGALRWAIFKTIGGKPALIKKTGTTFINQIGIELGIPSITYGPGDSKLEHTNEEFIDLEEFVNSIEVYSKFLTKFFENYKKKEKI